MIKRNRLSRIGRWEIMVSRIVAPQRCLHLNPIWLAFKLRLKGCEPIFLGERNSHFHSLVVVPFPCFFTQYHFYSPLWRLPMIHALMFSIYVDACVICENLLETGTYYSSLSLSIVSLTCGQLWLENIKWKIPETNNS